MQNRLDRFEAHPYRTTMSEGSKGIGTGFMLLLVIIALTSILGLGGWAWNVTYGQKMRRETINVDADYARGQTEAFRRLYGDIQAYDRQIADKTTVLAAESDPAAKQRYQIELSGLKNVRASAAQQYNADAGNVDKQRYLPTDLPPRVN